MEKQVLDKSFLNLIISGFVPVIFSLIIIVVISIGLRQAEKSSRAEGRRLLEDTILRVAIHNYAIEGHFPESLSYIVENFGVYIDDTRFIVHYEVLGANLLPIIKVFELG